MRARDRYADRLPPPPQLAQLEAGNRSTGRFCFWLLLLTLLGWLGA